MSETANLHQLRASLPVDRIAAQIGVDPAVASKAIDALLPSLVGGLGANAQDPARAASLEHALADHREGPAAPGAIDPAAIDTADGARIVRNIFGENTDEVVHRLGGATGGSDEVVKKLLPILAPIVLAWLASQLTKSRSQAQAGEGGGLVGQILSNVLGSGSSGGVLGGVLGSVLGGGAQSSSERRAEAGEGDGDTSSVRMPDVFSKPEDAPQQAQAPGEQSEQSTGRSPLDDLLGGLLGKGKR